MTPGLRERPLALVVDDDEVGRMICCDALREGGFDVLEADDGRPALALFQKELPDIILLDVVMNTMDGFEACEELRRLPGGATVPVLMMTGLDDIASIQRAYDAGATDFISKPFNWTVLIHRLRYMLRADLSLHHLRIAEHGLSEAQRIASLGSFQWTARDRQITVSREFLTLFNLTGEGRPVPWQQILRLIHRRDIAALATALRGAVKETGSFSVDCRLADESRGTRTLTVRGEAEISATGLTLLKGTIQDISERKRMELTLEAARERAELGSAAKTTFLGVMSHELRTPMNAIIGFAEILQSKLGTLALPGLQEYAGLVLTNGRHLLKLINDILQISQLEGKDVRLDLAPIEVAALAKRCLGVVRASRPETDITCALHFPPDLPLLSADERYLRQVLSNLISNALKFTAAGGAITIGAMIDKDGTMVIDISDTGIGMTDEDCEIAVQPFRQVGAWMTRHHEGSGLGLSIAKRIVEVHGGTFRLRSAVGVGTTASLLFPKSNFVEKSAA